jgi:archaeal type IV pilus assembly protein PilA
MRKISMLWSEQTMKWNKEPAVSPVIGVMLMLVVCIIIAAVVSGFAGGLTGGTEKAPQVTLGAKVVNGSSIIISNQGGDVLDWQTIKVKTLIPTGSFKDMSYDVNVTSGTYLPTNAKIYDSTTYTWAPSFKPGDEAKFNWTDCFATSSYGGYMQPSPGESVSIQIFDKNSGKTIVSKTATNN